MAKASVVSFPDERSAPRVLRRAQGSLRNPGVVVVPAPEWDEMQIEFSARQLEERRFAHDAEPLLRRLSFLAVELGPQALATVNHLAHLHDRHRRRWSHDQDGDGAAA